ncbi:unnamed protein product [Penicillium salamii]|uniref:SNF2 N-terminal domain-containing protein n=1 Tax=Penicillium salamii TaxID=1612424 RepID=A0A9W4NE19_9EURO|nr:unnamed protein product [Penicillium salamii]CAG8146864.1 unnamed protein product [Penicillium salamii]CAG8231589.1 unnamed protein product [Penicillium salamii]CAG8274523.1 unnamed protein product [Penicillium salamii]CAG8301235.1 unnamed protein product [Penicillium salamii]
MNRLRSRATIPDSEDSQFSDTSFQDPSGLRRSTRSSRSGPLRAGGSSLSESRPQRVIQDSETDEDDDPSNVATPEEWAPGKPAVVVSVKNTSPSDSVGNQSTTYSTPATSVGPTTDTDSKAPRTDASQRAKKLQSSALAKGPVDKNNRAADSSTDDDVSDQPLAKRRPMKQSAATSSNAKAPARVNATQRAKNLQSSTLGLAKRGTKRTAANLTEDDASDAPLAKKRATKRSAAKSTAPDTDVLDAALARSLQMEEYGQQPAQGSTQSASSMSDSESDSDLDDLESVASGQGLRYLPSLGYSSGSSSDFEDSQMDAELAPTRPAPRPTPRRPRPAGRSTARRTSVPESDHGSDEDLPPSWEEQRKAKRADADRKKLEKKHPVLSTMWDLLKAQSVLPAEAAKQPASITRKLKPFQLEGLSWMIRQEQTEYRGGLLGDEMGMGKTIQAVSLIMSDYPKPDPTLVLVPPVALMQWVAEIKAYTDGKLKVLVYHNSDPKIRKKRALFAGRILSSLTV